MHNRDDEDNRQRHSHDTETPQSKPKKPKLDTRPNWKRKKYVHRHERRHIKQTERNQKKTKPNGHLLYPSDGTRPECAVCKFTNKKNHRTSCQHGRTYCQHGIRELPENYLKPAHFRDNELSFYKHPPICPQYFHVLDDTEASKFFLSYLRLKGLPRPKSRAEMIKIFEDMRDPYDHPLNSNGTFEKTGRCKHQDNRGTDCTRNALIKENPFCFEHMPASMMLKVLPPPELEGTLAEQNLTKFVFWMQSRGGTDKDWSTKTIKEKEKILKGSAQRLKISLQNMSILTGNTANFIWLK